MRRFILLLLAVPILAYGPRAAGQGELQYLEDSYTHAILHAPPPPESAAGRRWREASCSPQTDLTGSGRLIAMAVGDSIQKSGTRVNRVVASPSCNAVVTARLFELGPVNVEEFLSPQADDESAPAIQRDEVIFYLAGLRPSDTALLVTHGGNITELAGVETVPGELLIIGVSPLGEVEVRFSIKPGGRPEAAASAPEM